MTSQQRLQQVLAHPAIWQARHTLTASGQMSCEQSGGSVASGYPQMDSALQGRGWPTGKLIECLYQHAGQHELHFFMPALAQLSRQSPPKYKTTRSDKKTPTENKDADQVRETSRYYDVANFVPRIKCPVLVAIGLLDESCPPDGIYAGLNQLTSQKNIVSCHPEKKRLNSLNK